MRLLLTGGGTGGHIYPALAVLEAWRRRHPAAEVAWAGNPAGMEGRIVAQEGLPFLPITAAAVRGRGPLGAASGLLALLRGTLEAHRHLGAWRPDAVLATGGYVTAPVLVAAALLRVPSLIFLPDIRPGLAVGLTSWLAAGVCVTSAAAAEHLRGRRVVETGYPVRSGLIGRSRHEARQRLGLASEKPVLLVAGGSQGARTINEATRLALPRLLALAQVVHICGAERERELRGVREALPEALRRDYHLYPFLHAEMPDALIAADLAVSRAGASVLGEYPVVGLPSILVPYPYAGAHQRENARLLARAGAAEVIENEELTPDRLVESVRAWLERPAWLKQASTRARALARLDAAERIADELERAAARQRP